MFRPTEVDLLIEVSTKSQTKSELESKYDLPALVKRYDAI